MTVFGFPILTALIAVVLAWFVYTRFIAGRV